MKKIYLIFGLFLTVIFFLTTVYAATSPPVTNILNKNPSENMNPLWVNTTYYTINETFNLTLFRNYGPFPLETIDIMPNQTQLPAGMIFPIGHRPPSLDGYVNTTGNWIPNYCQGGYRTYYNSTSNAISTSYKSYRFIICYNHSANPFPGCADTEWINISIRNKNRAPVISGSPDLNNNVIYVAAGENLHYNLQATDPDKTECSDNNLTMTCNLTSYNTGYTFNNINDTGVFDWTPSEADVGMHTLKFRASDLYSVRLNLSAGMINFTSLYDEKTITVYVYKPSFTWNVNENELLTFTDSMNSSNSSQLLSIQGQSLPSGASMPNVNGNTAIQTTFNWIPNYCQGNNVYQFSSNHYVNNNLAYTQTHTATVANVNRIPSFISQVPETKAIKVGKNFNLSLQATDPDMTECHDDTLIMNYSSAPSSSATFIDNSNGSALFNWTPATGEEGNYTIIFNAIDSNGAEITKQMIVNVGPSYVCGDANGDGTVDISDSVYLIAYIFSGGSAPNPLGSGDANGDGTVDISDSVYLIAYIFSGGSAPQCGPA
jgi:hypothetical protein